MGHWLFVMETVLQRAQAGDVEAFASIVRDHEGLVRATALAHMGDFELARDIAQDAFVVAWKQLSRVEPGCLRAYLVAVTRNLARNARRRRRDSLSPADAVDATCLPDEMVDCEQRLHLLRKAVERIPTRLRVPIILYYQHERSTTEVARALGISPAAARQRISRGTRKLRADLASQLESSVEADERKSQGFSAGVIASLPGWTPGTASPFSILGLLLGKKLVAAMIALVCSVGAVAGLAITEASHNESDDSATPQLLAAHNDIPTPAAATATATETKAQAQRPEAETVWVAPPWTEVPLVTGNLKLNRPEVDADGSGELSQQEIAEYKEEQALIMSRLIVDAMARADRAQEQPLTKRMHKALLHAIKRHGLAHRGVLRQPLRVIAPMAQFSLRISNTAPMEYITGEQRSSSEQVIADLSPGTPLSELENIRWSVPSQVIDTMAAYCDRVYYRRGTVAQDRIDLVLSQLPGLIESDTVDSEHLLSYLRPALHDTSSICVDFGLGFEHPLGDDIAHVGLDEHWDTLRMLVIEANGASISLRPALL